MITADLTGRTALVTGGVSGIGLATATLLGKMGARLALNHLPGDPAGPARFAEFQAQGIDAIAAEGNVGVPTEAEAMVTRAAEALGGLDFLVNNAGTSGVADKIPLRNWTG